MFVCVEKCKSKHYSNITFSLALKRSTFQKPRVSGTQKLLAGWRWGRNLFNSKLMRLWTLRSEQTQKRERANDSKTVCSVYSDGLVPSAGSSISEEPSREAGRRTAKASETEPGEGSALEASSSGSGHERQTVRKTDQTDGTQLCVLALEGNGEATELLQPAVLALG